MEKPPAAAGGFVYLRHLQIQGFAAEDVEMQVRNGLTGVCAGVGSHAIAINQAFGLGNLGNDFKNVSHNSAVFSGDIVNRCHVLLGDHQDMGRCLGRDIPESKNSFILVNLGGRNDTCNDLTEQTIRHGKTS